MDLSLQNKRKTLYFALKCVYFFCEKLEICTREDAEQRNYFKMSYSDPYTASNLTWYIFGLEAWVLNLLQAKRL